MSKELNITLYKKDSKGKIRSCRILTNEGQLHFITGLVEGKKRTDSRVCTPKNVGRANETNSKDQAISEGLSRVSKSIREGYFLTVKEAEDITVIKPMLAKSFKDEKDDVVYPCFVQPKLDGIRALKEGSKFRSRKNLELTTMKHIEGELSNLDIVLDGELYAHGLSFQDNTKLIKKLRPETVNVKFHVYDVITEDPYSLRNDKLKELLASKECSNIVLVPTEVANTEEDLRVLHDKYTKLGYEGIMIRHGKDGYKVNSRSSSLLKFKDFIDRAYQIIDIAPSNKRPEHGVPVCKVDDKLIPLDTPKVTWYKENGKVYTEVVDGVDCGYPTTRCGTKLSHKERTALLKNKKDYIGKTAEVRFFEFYSSGVPRFPVYYGVRLDK
jgi:DNA ligase-1